MLLNSVFNCFKNIFLLVLLLMTSLIVQAQDTQTSDAAATTTQTNATSAGEDQQRSFSFPRWPESRRVTRERIPLAPPGPYMSSALSDFSFEESSFDRDRNRHETSADSKADSSDMSMEKFSPDTPWPSQTKSPARWRPENGYRYIDSHAEVKSYQVMPYNSPSNYYYGYKRRPPDSWPGNNRPGGESGYRNPLMSAPPH